MRGATTTTTTTTAARRPRPLVAKLVDLDWLLLAPAAALALYGLVVVLSAGGGPDGDLSSVARQGLFVVVGSVALAVTALVDYRWLRRRAGLVLALSLVVLVAVLTPLGTEVRATRGWFQVGGFSVQPAELVKVGLIVVLSAVYSGRSPVPAARRSAVALGVSGVVAALVLAQGEVGSVLVYAAITLGVMVAAGVPRRHLAALAVLGALGVAVVLSSGTLKDYQQQRLTSFLDLDADARGAAYNQRQSITAVGSGGFLGQGLFDGPQTQLQFVPEQETDFIFTVVGEELGFLGSLVLLTLYSTLMVRIWRQAQRAGDEFGALLCVGVLVMLAFQLFQNVGMNVGIMPITGIPLPLISYGGSSMVTTSVAIGLVLSVSAHRYRGSFL